MKFTNKAFTLVEVMIVVFIIGILAAILMPVIGGVNGISKEYSTGSRVGVVTKLSEKGLVWKSWEGELNMGGVKSVTNSNGDSVTVANTFTFSVAPEAVEKTQAALNSGRRVQLHYRQWFVKPMTIDNEHVVTDVKYVE
jgi:prepilin-type N-terminal cleavage/methylation domain-containing protein